MSLRLCIRHEHRHSALGFVTPAERHAHPNQGILARHATVDGRARQRNPRAGMVPRTTGQRIRAVRMNPDQAEPTGAREQPGIRSEKQLEFYASRRQLETNVSCPTPTHALACHTQYSLLTQEMHAKAPPTKRRSNESSIS